MRVEFVDTAKRELTGAIIYYNNEIYQIRKDMILIVAVMHLHRHPDSWKHRT